MNACQWSRTPRGGGEGAEEAVKALVADLQQYAGDYLNRASLYLRASNRRFHFPYVLKILLARDVDEIRRGVLGL